MKRYIRSEHNPYPTVTFDVIGWKSSGQDNANLNKSFTALSEARKFAEANSDYYRIDIDKSSQYDGDRFPSTSRIAQYKYGNEQSRDFV